MEVASMLIDSHGHCVSGWCQ